MHWLDAFGGSGIVTYKKPVSVIESFNDYDEGISAIFYCLLFKFEELGFRLMEFNNQSETILRWIRSSDHQAEMKDASIVDKAISKLYQLNQSFSGKGESLGFRVDPILISKKNSFRLFSYDTWNAWRKRFELVQLFTRPANKLIKSLDSPNLFAYCDPPYVVTEKGNHYELNFTEQDHIALANVLHSIQGKFLLSYDDTPIIHELYANDEMNDLNIRYTFKVNNGDKKKELLISNYKLPRRPKLMEFLEPVGVENGN